MNTFMGNNLLQQFQKMGGKAFTDVFDKSNQEMKYKVTSQFYKRPKH
jgi:hypothetical protein